MKCSIDILNYGMQQIEVGIGKMLHMKMRMLVNINKIIEEVKEMMVIIRDLVLFS
jgi:hypothetical protein